MGSNADDLALQKELSELDEIIQEIENKVDDILRDEATRDTVQKRTTPKRIIRTTRPTSSPIRTTRTTRRSITPNTQRTTTTMFPTNETYTTSSSKKTSPLLPFPVVFSLPAVLTFITYKVKLTHLITLTMALSAILIALIISKENSLSL